MYRHFGLNCLIPSHKFAVCNVLYLGHVTGKTQDPKREIPAPLLSSLIGSSIATNLFYYLTHRICRVLFALGWSLMAKSSNRQMDQKSWRNKSDPSLAVPRSGQSGLRATYIHSIYGQVPPHLPSVPPSARSSFSRVKYFSQLRPYTFQCLDVFIRQLDMDSPSPAHCSAMRKVRTWWFSHRNSH